MMSFSEESSPPLQQCLQYILQSSPEWWVYSIFWQVSRDPVDGRVVLSWGDGYFRGSQGLAAKPRAEKHSKPNFGFDLERQVTKDLHTMLNDELDLERLAGADVTDYGWFYTVSMAQSFNSRQSNIIGRAFSSGSSIWLAGDRELQLYECERVKEARMHGIQTLVCIATPSGVVELGSSNIINEDWSLVTLSKSLFVAEKPSPEGQIPYRNASNSQKHASFEAGDMKKDVTNNLGRSSSDSGPSDSDGNFAVGSTRQLKRRSRNPDDVKEFPVNHVEAERQRRERLNHRFYALRSVVPNVSKMDKASLLADAVTYIKQLTAKVDELETQLQAASKKSKIRSRQVYDNRSMNGHHLMPTSIYKTEEMEMDVRILGSEAMIRVRSPDIDCPAARLTDALKELEFQVHHACVSSIKGMVLQDFVVRIRDGLTNEDALRTAILHRLMQNQQYLQ